MKVSPQRARELAEGYFAGRSAKVEIFTFGRIYVAWVRSGDPTDPRTLPETVGGGCLVIDKESGEIAVRPLLAPQAVADQFPR
ncbi:hypothetical protein [Microtetraspora sp. NBRC 16547]|uniref:hypothetical protein n=1 Tax=Microtetraspora sp. NBRC 16547 TaxID=3030993 RepID=UPI0024A58D7D|nr:hypothetical protein [Microtetraspora sp. NBRC 16547]GLX01277.1 hypothetical protein Misp02_53630 [Microtetraspora sp. NBRC 16547]